LVCSQKALRAVWRLWLKLLYRWVAVNENDDDSGAESVLALFALCEGKIVGMLIGILSRAPEKATAPHTMSQAQALLHRGLGPRPRPFWL